MGRRRILLLLASAALAIVGALAADRILRPDADAGLVRPDSQDASPASITELEAATRLAASGSIPGRSGAAGAVPPDTRIATGRVVDETGQPLEGAQVELCDEEGTVQATSSTDAEGTYRIAIVQGGPCFVLVECLGVGMGTSPRVPLTVKRDASFPDVVIRRGAEVSGTLHDGAGRPVAGVPVLATSTEGSRGEKDRSIDAPAGMDHGRTRTDAEGRFRITGLLPGRVWLAPVVTGWEVTSTAEAGAQDVRLVLDGRVVHLTVADGSGRPVPGATWAILESSDERSRPRRGEIGSEGDLGAFVLVREGAEIVASAAAAGCSPAEAEARCTGPEMTRVALRLTCHQPPARVRFEPTGDGAPLTHAFEVSCFVRSTGQYVPGSTSAHPVAESHLIAPGLYRVYLQPLPDPGSPRTNDLLDATVELTVTAGTEMRVPVPVRRRGNLRITITLPDGVRHAQLERIILQARGDTPPPEEVLWSSGLVGAGSGTPSLLATSTGRTGLMGLAPDLPNGVTGINLVPGRYAVQIYVQGCEPAMLETTVLDVKGADIVVRLELPRK